MGNGAAAMIARALRPPLMLALALALAIPARAQAPSLAAADQFRIGDTGLTCSATRRSEDQHYTGMFDRGYDIVCRDAASPVGTAYVLQGSARGQDLASADCTAEARIDQAGLPGLMRRSCRDAATGLTRLSYRLVRHGQTFAATGYAGYDSALLLALAALVADHPVPGQVQIAQTGAGDPAALARIEADRFDPAQALAAGMAVANAGDHADANEFFDRLLLRARQGDKAANRPGLYLAGKAIEQSIMGNTAEAARLFDRAGQAGLGDDPVFARLYRNLYAMHLLDRGDRAAALAKLTAPVPQLGDAGAFAPDRVAAGYIDHPLAQRLSLDDAGLSRFGSASDPLTDSERAQLLDLQALYLRAEVHRLDGNAAAARGELAAALAGFDQVRGGHVVSMAWLPVDVITAQAALAEADGKLDMAGSLLQQAVARTAALLPDSAAWLSARARLAALSARHGDRATALALYAALVRDAPGIPGGSDALRGQLAPYFAVLADGADAGAAAAAFAAAQVLVRPGVAQTQAVLARELSSGSDEAADLFRQSLALDREVRAIDQDLASGAATAERSAALTARRTALAGEQTAIQARLGSYARYVAVTDGLVPLAALQHALRDHEAYYKLILIGDAAYALWIDPAQARLIRLATNAAQLETLVNRTRDSVVSYQGNQVVTNPFDLTSARQLYTLLFGAVQGDLAAAHHLVFEPDGAMLKLPVGLLVTSQAGVDAYAARTARPDADAFDFTGVAWLARDHIVSTAVSANSFVAVRAIGPSHAPNRYLGLGHNAPPPPGTASDSDPCAWPRSIWQHPVSGDELTLAARVLGGSGNEVVAGADFTDAALLARGDLNRFRVVQFATHGLVTAPHPGCAAEPALVTSFGPPPSQGLLTFRDVFDLKLDADTVVLSACDTAGAASIDATRAAGIATGGNFALDGLVRAFVGAGARSVIASHWPVPDDFNATSRLMGGLFGAGIARSSGEALRGAQVALMDDPLTSHPYYWAAFAIVGDAAKPITTP